MNNNEAIKILSSETDSVKVFIPLLCDKELYDNFVVELLDLIEFYFYPIKYGLSKKSILDILEQGENLCEYLYKKDLLYSKKISLILHLIIYSKTIKQKQNV